VLGLSSREDPDPLTAAGQPALVTLDPQGTVEVRHILGAIRWPSGQSVAGVMLDGDLLTVTGDWTWNDRPVGDYDLIEYDCGSGRVTMTSGPGSCTTAGELEPQALTVVITQDGVEYPRTWSWADFD
jgi:hypothetical protein